MGDMKIQPSKFKMQELLAAFPVAIYTTDAEGRITYFNEPAVELTGLRPLLGEDQAGLTWKLYWPDGRPMALDECPMIVALKEGRIIRNVLAGIHSRYNRKVVEQAAIAGVLNTKVIADPQAAGQAAAYIAKRLDALADETERGWEGKFVEGEGFLFERIVRGVKDVAVPPNFPTPFGRQKIGSPACRLRRSLRDP